MFLYTQHIVTQSAVCMAPDTLPIRERNREREREREERERERTTLKVQTLAGTDRHRGKFDLFLLYFSGVVKFLSTSINLTCAGRRRDAHAPAAQLCHPRNQRGITLVHRATPRPERCLPPTKPNTRKPARLNPRCTRGYRGGRRALALVRLR